jgi:hypothetical protein
MIKKYDIFISHSKEDNKLAVALCHFLEEKKLRCWMAPRDVQAGKDYARCIIEGIQSSHIMVVILSEYSNRSHHVRNEVERAFNHQVAILPFRIRDIIPGESLEYFLSSYHWLDAIEGQAENYFDDLYRHCFALLKSHRSPDPPIPPEDDKKRLFKKDKYPVNDENKEEQKFNNKAIYIAGAVILGILLFFIFIRPIFDKNTIEFKNNAPAAIYIDLDGKTDTIAPNSSFLYSGRKNSRVKTNAYSYVFNSKGIMFGTKIQWNIDTLVHSDGNYIYNLDVNSSFFFLRITNNSGANITDISVNSNDPNEKVTVKTTVPNDGRIYYLGYYRVLPDTKIVLVNANNYSLNWTSGSNLHFADSFNEAVTLAYK